MCECRKNDVTVMIILWDRYSMNRRTEEEEDIISPSCPQLNTALQVHPMPKNAVHFHIFLPVDQLVGKFA